MERAPECKSSSSVGLLFRHLNISKEVPNTQGRDPTWSISISEFKRTLDFKREKNGQINGDLDPWDEAYFTRLMKSSAYSLDSLVVASYFPLTQCIEGLKVLVELLFGVTFRSIPLAPKESWHTDVLKMSLYHPEEGQLFQLMQRLESTTPHFIRCIKPNNVQSPGMYEQELVLQQLRCYGVLEVVRISRSGFPTKMTHQKFARRYGFLLLDNVASQDPLVFQLQFFISSIFCLRCIKLATQNCFSALASDRTKYYLLASFVLHIKHSESKDSAVSPRILLSGPTGHNLYLTGNN